MVTVAIVHKCTILHPLMWVFFCSNCVKLATFFILHNYTSTDAIALKLFGYIPTLSLSLHKTWTELISTTYRVLVAKVVSAFCYLIVLVLWVLRMKVLWLFFKFWNSLVQSWCGWQLGIGNAISKLLMGIGWNDTLVLFFTRIR